MISPPPPRVRRPVLVEHRLALSVGRTTFGQRPSPRAAAVL